MNKTKLTLLLVIGVLLTAGIVFFFVGSLRPKLAGVYIESSPSASVWIDGKQVGRTPFRETLKPSDLIIRLIPDSFEAPLAPYETKVALVAGVETVIRYDFGEIEDYSAGDIISFEQNTNSDASLVAVSSPDSAQLTIDGLEKVFTPYKTSALIAGEHELKFSLKGYQDRVVKVKTHEGYKLTAVAKLAKLIETNEADVATSEADINVDVKEQIEILSTPTGFLRVRSEASTTADEIGQVGPGEKYNLVSIDDKTGWYEIEFETGKSGWISNQYAKKLGSVTKFPVSITPSVSPKATVITPTKTTPSPKLTPT